MDFDGLIQTGADVGATKKQCQPSRGEPADTNFPRAKTGWNRAGRGLTIPWRKISGAWLQYDIPGEHSLVGRSAPDIEMEDGTRLGDLLQKGWGVLWNPGGGAELKSLQESRENRVMYVSAKAKNDLGLSALLVRPDGFVAWASDGEPDTQAAAAAMQHGFGDGNQRGRKPPRG